MFIHWFFGAAGVLIQIFLRNWVMTTGTKWVTSANSFESEPRSLDKPIFLDCFQCVLRARGGVATCWWNPFCGALVNTDQKDSDCFSHRRSISSIICPKSFESVSNSALSEVAFATITESHWAKRAIWSRVISVTRRRTRLRLARQPIFRAVVTPIAPVPDNTYMVRLGEFARSPSEIIC